MKKIGLFYATKADKTTWVAEKIQKEFGKDRIEVVPIEQAWQNDFAAYDCFIVGASTWFDGELPTYWDELLPELRTLDLKGKKVAIFGLGDQIRYPENFADGIGLLAEVFEGDGATLVGFTSSEGYRPYVEIPLRTISRFATGISIIPALLDICFVGISIPISFNRFTIFIYLPNCSLANALSFSSAFEK